MKKDNKIWLIILASVSVYLAMCIYADFGKLTIAISEFYWPYLFILFALTTANYLLRFIKWDYFLKKAGIHMPLKENLFVFASGLSMIITPGKMGEIWKAWLIKDIEGTERSKTIPVVIIERITDVLGLVILSLAGALYYKQNLLLILAFPAIILIFFACIKSKALSKIIISKLESKTGKYAENIKTMHKTFQKTLEPKGMLAMSLLSALAWLFECLGLYLVIQGFGHSISMLHATFIFSFASLAGAISMLPGGLGVAEATIFGLLELNGIPAATSVGIAIIARLGTLWYGAFMGLAIYLAFKKKYHKKQEK
ncbi:MAG: flippase-like domain-containing protein [Candidatus Aenigmarchaeota archaeon]|nr:flippase-like domain-containing protein [Candidatus Aenigmarchaeota archaeon]